MTNPVINQHESGPGIRVPRIDTKLLALIAGIWLVVANTRDLIVSWSDKRMREAEQSAKIATIDKLLNAPDGWNKVQRDIATLQSGLQSEWQQRIDSDRQHAASISEMKARQDQKQER